MFFPGWIKKSGFFCKTNISRKKMMVKRKIICKRGILKQRVFCLFLYHHAIIHKHHYSVGYWEDTAILLSHLTYLFYCLLVLVLFYGQHLILTWHSFKKREIFRLKDEIWLNFFFCMIFSKNIHPRKLHFSFLSPEKLAHLCLLKDFKPSPNCKMIKLLTFDNLFLLLWQSL